MRVDRLRPPASSGLRAPAWTWLWVAAGAGWFVYWFWGYRNFANSEDEQIHIVSAWMINSGARLYEGVFSHHGPLVDVVSTTVLAATGSFWPAPYRMVVAAFYVLAAVAIYVGLGFRQAVERTIAAGAFLFLVGKFAPVWAGHMLIYHNLGAAFLLIAVALHLAPEVAGMAVPRWRAAVAGACLPAAVFCAYSFLPAVALYGLGLLLFRASRGSESLRSFWSAVWPVAAGAALSTAGMLAWLALHGNIKGYLALHIYLNQSIYSKYLAFSIWEPLTELLAPGHGKDPAWFHNVFHVRATVLFLALGALLIWRTGAYRRRPNEPRPKQILRYAGYLVLACYFIWLNPRNGRTYSSSAYYLHGLALMAVTLAVCAPWHAGKRRMLVAGLLVVGMIGVLSVRARAYPSGLVLRPETVFAGNSSRPELTEAVALAVKDLTRPGDKVVFHPYIASAYLWADRAPAVSDYFFLPWQADYAQKPFLGVSRNVCADLESAKPSAIVVEDDAMVWQGYHFGDYGNCVADFAKKAGYEVAPQAADTRFTIYVRKAPAKS